MLFNSFEYFLFLPLILLFMVIIPRKFYWLFLLSASYFFYAYWKIEYLFLIILSTIIDYLVGLSIPKVQSNSKKKALLLISLFANLGLLFFFKYYNFFGDLTHSILGFFNVEYHPPESHLLLPVGISFYTFQTLSYTIEVYKGEQKPCKSFTLFSLYVSYFPQLVAGPIERSTCLIPQLEKKIHFTPENLSLGLKLIFWGLFKKMVIADRLGDMVDAIYNNQNQFSGPYFIVATIFFAFQIFCDFSGYSDIAIGSAQMMGVNLMKNFDRPYFSKNISEFWKRWHISLSTWFRDYVYIPLGGSRVKGTGRLYFNLFITFILSGLWHGANLTFVAWGALNGFYLVSSLITKNLRKKILDISKLDKMPFLYKLYQVGVTFSLTCFAWVFFRANSISDAGNIFKKMFLDATQITMLFHPDKEFYKAFNTTESGFKFAVLMIILMEGIHLFERGGNFRMRIKVLPIYVKYPLYLGIVLLLINKLYVSDVPFIYFQF